MLKVVERSGIQGIYQNIIKAIYSKPTAKIKSNREETRSNPPKIQDKTRLPTLSLSIQYNMWHSSQSNKTTKGDQGGYRSKRKKSKYDYLQVIW